MGLQGVTRGERALSRFLKKIAIAIVTGSNRELQGVTGGYKRLQWVTGGYKRLRGVTGG